MCFVMTGFGVTYEKHGASFPYYTGEEAYTMCAMAVPAVTAALVSNILWHVLACLMLTFKV